MIFIKFIKDECVIIDKTKKIVARIKITPNKVFYLCMPIEDLALKFEENNTLYLVLKIWPFKFQKSNFLKLKNMVTGLLHINKRFVNDAFIERSIDYFLLKLHIELKIH